MWCEGVSAVHLEHCFVGTARAEIGACTVWRVCHSVTTSWRHCDRSSSSGNLNSFVGAKAEVQLSCRCCVGSARLDSVIHMVHVEEESQPFQLRLIRKQARPNFRLRKNVFILTERMPHSGCSIIQNYGGQYATPNTMEPCAFFGFVPREVVAEYLDNTCCTRVTWSFPNGGLARVAKLLTLTLWFFVALGHAWAPSFQN